MVNNSNFIRGLTPRQAWDIYSIPNVQLFDIRFLYLDEDCDLSKNGLQKNVPVICKPIFPEFYEAPFLQEDLDYIARIIRRVYKRPVY